MIILCLLSHYTWSFSCVYFSPFHCDLATLNSVKHVNISSTGGLKIDWVSQVSKRQSNLLAILVVSLAKAQLACCRKASTCPYWWVFLVLTVTQSPRGQFLEQVVVWLCRVSSKPLCPLSSPWPWCTALIDSSWQVITVQQSGQQQSLSLEWQEAEEALQEWLSTPNPHKTTKLTHTAQEIVCYCNFIIIWLRKEWSTPLSTYFHTIQHI